MDRIMNMYAKARRGSGLTQRQAARALGLSVSLLGRYERDESCPNRRMVESMALLYGVPAGRLGAFGADECAAMLEGRNGRSVAAYAYMGRIRLECATPARRLSLAVPGTHANGVWIPGKGKESQ